MKAHDNLVTLTTNVWADGRKMHGATETLLCQVSEILLRMGHEAGCYLYHGQESAEIQALSQQAVVSTQSTAWDIPAEGWQTLQDEILPAIAAEQKYDGNAFS